AKCMPQIPLQEQRPRRHRPTSMHAGKWTLSRFHPWLAPIIATYLVMLCLVYRGVNRCERPKSGLGGNEHGIDSRRRPENGPKADVPTPLTHARFRRQG